MRSIPNAALALSLLVLLGMYLSNASWDANPSAPRGDGKYRPILARGDGHMMYMMTQSLVLDRDLIYDNQLAAFGDPWRQPRTITGRKMIPHPIGPSLAQAPGFAVAHLTAKIANLFGAKIPQHGYSMWHQRIVFLVSVFAAFGAILMGFWGAKRWLEGQWGPIYASMAVLFGTSLTYYATYMPSYAHALDAFFCSAFLGYWILTYQKWCRRRVVILGVLLGLSALIRVTGFALGSVVLVEVLLAAFGPKKDTPRPRQILSLVTNGAGVLIISLLVFIPQLITWKLVFGTWLTSPMGPGFMRLSEPQWMEFLFSSRNGWLSTHPIAYFGLLGLFFVPKRCRGISLALLSTVVLFVYINSCVFDWWSGASFGQRRMCSLTFVLVFGLCALLRAGGVASKKLPAWSLHCMAVGGLGWFVLWNLSSLHSLRNGKSANSGVHAMCCKGVDQRLTMVAQPVYQRVGNPFSLPASLLMAWKYGVPIQRWDNTAGTYADFPVLAHYNSGQHRSQKRSWSPPAHFLLAGFGPEQSHNTRKFRWTVEPSAGLLVPLFVANEARTFSVQVFSPVPSKVTISWNDTPYLETFVHAKWNHLSFSVPPDDLQLGMNQLSIHSELSPYLMAIPPSPPQLPPHPTNKNVGVALRSIVIGYDPQK